MASITLLQPDDSGAESLVIINGNFSELNDAIEAGGTVYSVSVVSANGLAGTVANATTAPAITLSTTVTGLLKGNGTTISAATAGTDYMTASSTNTLTNKTYDTAGTGNSFSINGVAATANTGTGSVVRATSPALVTPDLGTPTALVGTNITGTATALSIGGNAATATTATTASTVTTNANLTGPITSVGNATSIASQTGTGTKFVVDTSPVLVTPNLGTPTALVGTNITGTAAGLTAGNVTTNANLTGAVTSSGNATSLGSFSSANLISALTDETGSGSAVFGTNPTIAKPVMNARNQTAQTYSPAGAGTATLDLSLADQHYITMPAGNITIALSNVTNNQIFLVSITQDSGGSRTVTWFTTIRWAGGSPPTLTTTADKRDTFGFIRTGSGTYDGFVIGQNI